MMQKENIHKKLFDIQKQIGKISKDSTNPFHKSKYFDINQLLEHVHPLLEQRDILCLQPIVEGKVFTVLVDIDSGEKVESYLELSGDKNPQKVGSEITYFRRYTLASLLCIQAEDDDGNRAAAPEKKTPVQKEWFNEDSPAWNRALDKKLDVEEIKKHYQIRKEVELKYKAALLETINNQ